MGKESTSFALFNKTQQSLLTIFFSHPDELFHTRHLIRLINGSVSSVHKELKDLTFAGILTSTRQGNQVLYQANANSPIYAELKGLIVKTFGVADKLRAVLAPLADRIRIAFIYGSFAKGEFQAQSDVDVLIVGEVSFEEVVEALYPLQMELSREINSVVYSVDEFCRKLHEGQHFVSSVIKEEKIFLIGDENELGRLGKE
jgi:predicted nucleotidyltransferase